MFGSSRPVVIDRYGSRRSRRVPRWLLLLLFGIAVGAGGVVWIQENYLPPRLSAGETAQLRSDYTQADAERNQLKKDLAEATTRLDAALTDGKSGAGELAASRQTVERLRANLAFVADALPPDPRGGTVEVRAGRFVAAPGKLDYDVLLYRDKAGGKPLGGVVQFVLSGESSRGGPTTVAIKPLPVSIGQHEGLTGSLPLPEGFRPRQATINVLDRPDGRSLGMRVMYVK
jgi:multidrug efflux pump subunit AcrA (membrane-fusion protein)